MCSWKQNVNLEPCFEKLEYWSVRYFSHSVLYDIRLKFSLHVIVVGRRRRWCRLFSATIFFQRRITALIVTTFLYDSAFSSAFIPFQIFIGTFKAGSWHQKAHIRCSTYGNKAKNRFQFLTQAWQKWKTFYLFLSVAQGNWQTKMSNSNK